jgi:hypothetical protein
VTARFELHSRLPRAVAFYAALLLPGVPFYFFFVWKRDDHDWDDFLEYMRRWFMVECFLLFLAPGLAIGVAPQLFQLFESSHVYAFSYIVLQELSPLPWQSQCFARGRPLASHRRQAMISISVQKANTSSSIRFWVRLRCPLQQ